jgi:preprotein translocase subunit YajC
MNLLNVLAQATKPVSTQPESPGMVQWLFPIIMIFVFVYFIMLRPKRDQKHRDDMLSKMKKYDKVVTIGGIIGTIMEVRDDEVILKVDDNSNTRIKFSRGAISKILGSEESPDKK